MTIQAPDPLDSAKIIFEVIFGILVFIAIGYLVWNNDHLRATVAQQAAEITDYKGANEQFANQVQDQNAAIALMQTQEKEREENVAKAIAAAQKDAQALYDRAAKIMAKKPGQKDDCAAAKSLLNTYFGGR